MKRFFYLFILSLFYLSELNAQDITKILPAPPDTKSMEFVNDYMQYKWGKTVRSESTGKLAYNFIMWDFPSFLKSLGKGVNMTLSEGTTPKIYKLLSYANENAEKVISSAQKATDRQRPYVMFDEKSFVQAYENKYKDIGSYPCEQAVKGWLFSLILAEVAPKSEETIYERGLKYGFSMTIAGYSFYSDVNAGHLMACAILSRLHCKNDFATLLKDAKAEYKEKAKTRDDRASSTRSSDEPYISTGSLPRSGEYLPAPPEELSCEQMYDIVAYNKGKFLREEKEGEQAIEDVEYGADNFCKIFSKVLGHEISSSKTPAIYELVNRVHPSGNAATQNAKGKYKRLRPYVYMDEPTSYPDDEKHLKDTGSYPSGHASGSWLMALVLSEVTRSNQDELLRRAYEYGQGRMITGYHWQSDVDYGRIVGSTVYASLHGVSDFTSQMEKAIKEYQSVYGGGTSAVRAISAEEADSESAPVYNLQGQRVDHPAKGIYIQGNSKRVVR